MREKAGYEPFKFPAKGSLPVILSSMLLSLVFHPYCRRRQSVRSYCNGCFSIFGDQFRLVTVNSNSVVDSLNYSILFRFNNNKNSKYIDFLQTFVLPRYDLVTTVHDHVRSPQLTGNPKLNVISLTLNVQVRILDE